MRASRPARHVALRATAGPGRRFFARRRALAALALAAAVAPLAAACGVASPDLFVVTRTGPGGPLTVLVSEEGGVRCNGGPEHRLEDHAIIEARTITEGLHGPISRHRNLPARPGSVYAYRVRDAEGTTSFADNSANLPAALERLQLFVQALAQRTCRAAR